MVLNETVKLLGISMRETEDELTKNMLASTASILNCVYGGNGDSPTELTTTDVDVAVRTLLNNDARLMLEGIEGENRFGTGPARDSYLALTSTQITPDLNNNSDFINKNNYPSQSKILQSEYGTIHNLRFLISSLGSFNPSASALGADVFNIFCVGMESYAVIDQDMASAQLLYTPPILTGPLALYCRLAYKFAEVPRILNDAWILNLRCTRLFV